MGRLQALVFDFDGLILDTETPTYEATRAVFAEHGVELSRDYWRTIIGGAAHLYWPDLLERELGRPLDDLDAVIERRNATRVASLDVLAPMPGVVDLLAAAGEAAVPCAVASSSPSSWVHGHLERLGLAERFELVRGRDHVERAKPAPDLYLAAARDLGVDTAGAVALEDSVNGVEAAAAAGMAVVACPHALMDGLAFDAASMVVASIADVALADLAALVE